ncbi:MAG: STAS domain-containing protein [Phycisphaerales bacterium]
MSDTLLVKCERGPKALVMRLEGAAGMAEMDELTERIDEVIAEKPKLVILDLNQLSFVNSLVIGAFVRLNRGVRQGGGAMRIARPPEFVRSVLIAMNMHRAMPIFPDVEAAMA